MTADDERHLRRAIALAAAAREAGEQPFGSPAPGDAPVHYEGPALSEEASAPVAGFYG